jgi:hypothetical protein
MMTLNANPGEPSTATSGAKTSSPRASLKYFAQIQKISGCPPHACQGTTCKAYRFAGSKLDSNSFLPIALITPQRNLRGRPVNQCCTGYSLSFFQTLDQLRERAKEGIKNSPNFLKRIGDHFVCMKIAVTDGISTAVSKDGHFDFFEFVSFDAEKSVEEHRRLVP